MFHLRKKIVHAEENVQLEQVEQEELQELAEQLQEDKAEEVVVEHLEPIIEQVISPESAVNIEPVLDTPVIEKIDEETVKNRRNFNRTSYSRASRKHY